MLFPLAQNLLKGTIRCVVPADYSGLLLLMVIRRDGDIVQIRPSEDGKILEIKDNHVADPSIGSSSPAVNVN